MRAPHSAVERTTAARKTFLARFEDAADADLDPEERDRRVEERKRQFFTELSRRAAEARTLAAPVSLEIVAVVFMGVADGAAA